MKTDERLEWFACKPAKLLGAMGAMQPDCALVYVTVILRIYEVRGPASEDASTLSRRTGLSKNRCQKSLNWLQDNGKLSLQDDRWMNDFAEQTLRQEHVLYRKRKEMSKHALNFRWQKDKQNQQNGHTVSISSVPASNTPLPIPIPIPKKDTLFDKFEELWLSYPKRQSKKTAVRAYSKALREISHESIMAALDRAKKTDSRFRDMQFTPLLASWLNAGGWFDEPGTRPTNFPVPR